MSNSGEEMYQCIWIKNRGPNVLEVQIGSGSLNTQNFTDELCAKTHFSDTRWITEASE